MTPQVEILSQNLINKIAAGEVIVRPASVVKELVENAFDAEARRVRVEVSKDGRSISVIDDGCGMDEEDAKRAILRHSTSKIRDFDDLEHLLTRGFRGEALASIISVSRFELITRRSEDVAGVRIVASGGKVERVEPMGAAPGTTIHVRDLFYNTPARLKFLKIPTSEFNAALQILTQQALSRPEVGVACLREGEVRFDLATEQDLRSRIEELLGSSVHGRLLEIDFEREGLAVRGYASHPDASRKDRRWQYLMINGRPIGAKQLSHPIQEAYRGLLMQQRFPIVVLDIQLDLTDVDVNVHPTKDEVRFGDERKVGGLLHRAISQALHANNLMPTLEMTGANDQAVEQLQQSGDAMRSDSRSQPPQQQAQPGAPANRAPKRRPQPDHAQADPSLPFVFSPSGVSPYKKGARVSDFLNFGKRQSDMFPPGRSESQAEEQKPKSQRAEQEEPESPESMQTQPAGGAPTSSRRPEQSCSEPPVEEPPKEIAPPNASALSLRQGPPPAPLGQVGDSYIMAAWGDDLLLIDQHAAHERLIYRRLCSQPHRDVASQKLLAPITFSVAANDRETMTSLEPLLREMGIEIAASEPGSYEATALPADFDNLDVAAFVEDLLDDLRQLGPNTSGGLDVLRDRVRIRMSCHSAIKAGQPLHADEISALVRQITEADLSFTCPHGRPTMVLLRKDQLDRQFGRK